MIVDEQIDENAKNFGIEPLPNLEFKFVCANTLIPLDEGPNSLFDTDLELKKHLIDLRDRYYASTRKVDKVKIRKEYLFSIQKEGELFASKRELQLRDYNPFNPLNSTNFYDPELMHGVGSFDVVIGNPPYGAKLSEEDILNFRKKYTLKTSETAILFIEKGFLLLKSYGIESYIIPKSFSFASNYSQVRDYMKESLYLLGDTGKAFEEVKIEACIVLFKKDEILKDYKSIKYNLNKEFKTVSIIDKELKDIFGFFPNGLEENEIKIGLKILQAGINLNDISENSRGESIQKKITNEGTLNVIGGKEIDRFRVRSSKGCIREEDVNHKSRINNNSLLVQNIIAHLTKPFDHMYTK